ncbi:MAG: hypothetical protein K6U87_16080 [Firmicutes bacterium]|nr:hypothetical protein [Bacillota bacterium]
MNIAQDFRPAVELEMIDAVRGQGGKLYLLGGRAVQYWCRGRVPSALERESADIDFFTTGASRRMVAEVMEAWGCRPEQEFNLLNGKTRLLYYHGATKVDIFVDSFRMSHPLDLRSRLSDAIPTIAPSDLLLTKLQVFEVNRKDLADAAALLLALEGEGPALPAGVLDYRYVAAKLAADWGLWRTVTLNLGRLIAEVAPVLDLGSRRRLEQAVEQLGKTIDQHPKSLAWRVRARVGERVRWYEVPEEP